MTTIEALDKIGLSKYGKEQVEWIIKAYKLDIKLFEKFLN